MSYTLPLTIKLLPTDTGLTLKIQLVDADGSNNGSEITSGFTELGGGEYFKQLTVPDDFEGYAKVLSGSSTYQTSYAIGPGQYENNDASVAAVKAKTDLISSGTAVSVVNPVASTGALTLIRGDDYGSTPGNLPQWSSDSWPDLTGATVEFSAKSERTGTVDLDGISMTVTDAGESTQTVSVTLTDTQTAALSPGVRAYLFDIQATLSGGEKRTLVRDYITVQEDVTDA